MDPHKPVRIGLRTKPSSSANENPDFSDIGDALMSQAVSVADPQENLDATVQDLISSTMKVLEGLVNMESEVQITTVSSNESIDILADDVDLDLDPDYVPPPPELPSTSRQSRSKGKALMKPTATGGA